MNYSVFKYEIEEDVETALSISKLAFESAIVELQLLEGEEYRDSSVIMQLLQENITHWEDEVHIKLEAEEKEKQRLKQLKI